jgi:hypothetical protein
MRLARLALAAVVVVSLAVLPAAAATLEGRWKLVEETYGAGGSNLMRHKPPETMEFVREAGGLAGTIRIGAAGAQRWPLSAPGGAHAASTGEDVTFSPGEDHVHAHYLTPENADHFHLDIVEDYRVSEDGASLTGTMTVTFLQDGEPRGSYVLHRTFERQP